LLNARNDAPTKEVPPIRFPIKFAPALEIPNVLKDFGAAEVDRGYRVRVLVPDILDNGEVVIQIVVYHPEGVGEVYPYRKPP
jgi:hypothetical protein